MRISVIGGGPIGCYAAYKLSRNHDVEIYEEHMRIGEPVQCTGIVTSKIKDIFKLPNKLIVNKLKYARLNSPDGSSVNVKVNDLVIERTSFDQHLGDMAIDEGARLNLDSKFIGYYKDKQQIRIRKNNNIIKTKPDILIGADGPNSKVRGYITSKKIDYLIGKQAIVKGNFDKDTFDVFFNVKGFFSWIVPEDSGTARIGYAYKKYDKRYDDFIRSKGKILSWQAGVIPIFDPFLKTRKKNLYIVGDAACQVKASTGGGIVPGMIAAEALAKSIEDEKNYDLEWRKRLLTGLSMHKKIRKILDRFNNKDYDNLIRYISDKKIKDQLEKSNRDEAHKLLPVLFKQPKLLKSLIKLF